MNNVNGILRKVVRFFIDDNQGSATVESVLWLPVFIAIFGLIADASLIFNAQANLTRLVQDANRSYSIGRLHSAAETEAYVRARIGAAQGDADTKVTTTVSNGVITTSVVVEAGHYMAVGLFSALTGLNLRVISQHMMES